MGRMAYLIVRKLLGVITAFMALCLDKAHIYILLGEHSRCPYIGLVIDYCVTTDYIPAA